MHELRCDEEQQDTEGPPQMALVDPCGYLDSDLDPGNRGDPERECRPDPEQTTRVEASGAHGRGRNDREQRGCRGLDLAETERDQDRDEEDAAADAEEPGEDARPESEDQRQDERRGAQNSTSQVPTAARSAAKPSVSIRPVMRA
jgi:hypothetical protein